MFGYCGILFQRDSVARKKSLSAIELFLASAQKQLQTLMTSEHSLYDSSSFEEGDASFAKCSSMQNSLSSATGGGST